MTDWRNSAACRDYPADMWFVERGEDTTPAKAVCAFCPVRTECLEYANDNDIWHGIWGGLAPKQRQRARGWRV